MRGLKIALFFRFGTRGKHSAFSLSKNREITHHFRFHAREITGGMKARAHELKLVLILLENVDVGNGKESHLQGVVGSRNISRVLSVRGHYHRFREERDAPD